MKINIGDVVVVKYIGNQNEAFTPRDLKRLFGWAKDEEYRLEARLGKDGSKQCDVYYNKSGKYNCAHHFGNIENNIAKGVIKVLQPMQQLSLFS